MDGDLLINRGNPSIIRTLLGSWTDDFTHTTLSYDSESCILQLPEEGLWTVEVKSKEECYRIHLLCSDISSGDVSHFPVGVLGGSVQSKVGLEVRQ